MSCQQCGCVEHFEEKPSKGCDLKESMTNCIWDAQGMFVCKKETGMKELVPNKEMAQQVFEMKNMARFAAGIDKQS